MISTFLKEQWGSIVIEKREESGRNPAERIKPKVFVSSELTFCNKFKSVHFSLDSQSYKLVTIFRYICIMLKIEKCGENCYRMLVKIWERSVRATHDFLTDDAISEIREALVPNYFPNVELYGLKDDGTLRGFIGLSGDRIEMLFIDGDFRGKGYGSALMDFAKALGAAKVDVNEQNPRALDFYLKHGFRTIGRTETDETGRPYPLLHLSLTVNVTVREESRDEFGAIREFVKSAFRSAEHTDGDEHNLVDRLRGTPEYIPELSLVAIKDGKPVGHVMLSKIKIGETEAVALAPLAVVPAYQNRGIGRRLIEEAHRRAKKMGFKCCVVLGSPAYYSQSGYITASRFGIRAPFDVPDEYYMVCPLALSPEALPSGLVSYSPAFGI